MTSLEDANKVEDKVLFLDTVDRDAATFSNLSGWKLSMPRQVWSKKGRPGMISVSGRVV